MRHRDGGASSSTNGEEKKGTIQVFLYEAYEDENDAPTEFNPAPKDLPGGKAAIDKEKEFWTQPSATVGCDEISTATITSIPSRQWRYRSYTPFLTNTVYYHTPNVLKILQMIETKDRDAEGEGDIFESHIKEEHSSASLGSRKSKKPLEDTDNVISLLDDVLPQATKKKAKRSSNPIVMDLT
jgi:hypothetical protein